MGRDLSGKTLLIIGCGQLGTLVAKRWLDEGGKVVARTQSTARHSELKRELPGAMLESVEQMTAVEVAADYVLLAVPPSRNRFVYGEVARNALQRCSKANCHFVFTSSGSVYRPKDGSIVTESSDVYSPNENEISMAESIVSAGGGAVVRLAGLYNIHRGPHHHWLVSGVVKRGPPNGLINLIHYEDAASFIFEALLHDSSRVNSGARAIYLAADENPISRRDICSIAIQHSTYKNYGMPQFIVPDDLRETGRIYNCSFTRERFPQWRLKFESFNQLLIE